MANEKSQSLATWEDSSAKSAGRRGTNKSSTSPLMTTEEVAAYLGVSRWTVQRMSKGRHARLHRVKIRGCTFYQKTEVYALTEPETESDSKPKLKD